jgi:glutathione S-transferase
VPSSSALSLETHLGRVDRWIGEGTLGGAVPNAAGLQIGAGLALLMTVADVRPLVADRPAGELVSRWFAGYPGSTPAETLPAGWLPR